jgi:hypothetical protein
MGTSLLCKPHSTTSQRLKADGGEEALGEILGSVHGRPAGKISELTQRAQRRTDAELDAVGNGGLHAIEEEEAAEEDESDDGAGSEKKKAGGLAAAGDGPAKTVNDAGHGVEAVEPAPLLRDESAGIGDGRGEHPELDEERNDVFDVAVESVESGKPEADAESGEERKGQERGEPKSGKSGADAVSDGENGEDYEADGEVYEAGKGGGNRENEAREIHFGDEALVVNDDVGGHLKGVGEVGPGDESGEIEDRVREAIGGELGEAAEKESEDEHGEDGLENHPEDADGGLFVADFDVAPDEEVEEFAVGPDFAEAKLEEAAGRLDANGGGGAGMEREGGGGLRDGCHAFERKLLRVDEALIRVSKKTGEEARAKEKLEN